MKFSMTEQTNSDYFIEVTPWEDVMINCDVVLNHKYQSMKQIINNNKFEFDLLNITEQKIVSLT